MYMRCRYDGIIQKNKYSRRTWKNMKYQFKQFISQYSSYMYVLYELHYKRWSPSILHTMLTLQFVLGFSHISRPPLSVLWFYSVFPGKSCNLHGPQTLSIMVIHGIEGTSMKQDPHTTYNSTHLSLHNLENPQLDLRDMCAAALCTGRRAGYSNLTWDAVKMSGQERRST